MTQFLLQMTGESGTGKSSLATAIGRWTGAVVIDKDIIKSRLLEGEAETSLAGLSEAVAAPLHHAVLFDLARSFVQQGFSVVVDGAAFYPLVRRRGQEIATAAGARYFIIECCLPDLSLLQARIDSKVLMASQPRTASLGGFLRPGTEPLTEPRLSIDTRRPFDEYLAEALAYIGASSAVTA